MDRAQMIADLVAAHSRLSLLPSRDWTWSKQEVLTLNGQPTYTLSTPGEWPATYMSAETDTDKALTDVWQRKTQSKTAEAAEAA